MQIIKKKKKKLNTGIWEALTAKPFSFLLKKLT